MDEGFAAGTEIGGYRIESLLGRGGMGVVYRAHDLALDRPVALKLLAPELADDVRFRERFLRESRLAASLDHPTIVPIYDAGQSGQQLYIAMRLVDGSDLKQLLRTEGKLEPARALQLVEPVALALDAAHARGLLHRDVKPSNVLIDSAGHCYLADFGLSRRLADIDVVSDGRSLGTIDYVAPEQIRGDELDARADLYSLGCLLYECLAGRPPFTGSDTAIAFAHLETEPPPLPRLESVMKKALAKEPDDRYQSGGELIDATRDALGLARSGRSRWPIAAAVIGVAVVGAALLGFFLTRSKPQTKVIRTPIVEPGADRLVRISQATNKIISTMPVGRNATGVAVAGNYVWVTSFTDGTVWRIESRTRAVRKISVNGSPTGVAAVQGLALVANDADRGVVSVTARDGSVSRVARLPGGFAGRVQVASGPEGLWFADAAGQDAAQVAAFPGATPSTKTPIPADETTFLTRYKALSGLAVGGGYVWAVGDAFGRTLWKLDPISQKVDTAIDLPFIPRRVAVGSGSVWVTSALDDAVWRINPVTGRIVARVAVPRGVSAIAAGGGSVWVASSIDRIVSRIDPRRNKVVASIATTGSPTQLALDAGTVWVTTKTPAPVVPAGSIGIGVLADCEGQYASGYDRSLAGAEDVLIHNGGFRAGAKISDGIKGATVAGKPVTLALGCSNGTSESALAEARRLVEQVGVGILIGPVEAPDQLALLEYARRHPGIAFVNGTGGAQVLSPPSNVFSFAPDAAEWMAGVGAYAYKKLGWRHAVVVSDMDDDLYNWAQAAGFTAEFCALGGSVKHVWVPSKVGSYAGVVAQIPRAGVDGIVVTGETRTLIALARRVPLLGGDLDRRLLLGAVDGSGDFGPLGGRAANLLWSGYFFQRQNPAAFEYNNEFQTYFRDVDNPEQIWDFAYHRAMAGAIDALAAVKGDLSGGERRFMSALARVRLNEPTGRVRLDSSREAVGANYIATWVNNVVLKVAPGVEHTFGGYFGPGDPPPSRTTPACKHGNPPTWAR